jgi:predicted DNA-binding transcriptional regulator AlpA
MHPHALPASAAHQDCGPSLSVTSGGASTLTFGDASPVREDGPVTAESPDPDLEWWTTSDVAAYLDVRVSTVSNYRKSGRLPEPDQTVGRTHMWRPSRIIEWHDSRTRVGVGGRPRATTDVESPTDQESEITDSAPTNDIESTPESGQ